MQLTHSEKVDGLLRAEQFSSARKWYYHNVGRICSESRRLTFAHSARFESMALPIGIA